MKTVRCAIYTRKSSEEGLEQSFNSLDAQREACAAYILSQASEGWTALCDIYDDGGLSGGTLERPALQRLLADVAAGRIDIIVVYKVDRLTRSLLDFAKLVEAFDKAGTSFVSVTQSFNTTTSMGRLTLNMLLSFAQFEREVTAERIRDKIAASKAKGMWMGGTPPLGYRPDGRTLAIVEGHAAVVRHIFDRYLTLGNVRSLADELARNDLRLPHRRTLTGKEHGGGVFARGHLYSILRNPLYAGKIAHRGQTYDGQHPPIIELGLWRAVQAQLDANRQGHRRRARLQSPSLLAGKVVDAAGMPLVAVHACKGTTRYRYYVSRALQEGQSKEGWRIPARELERVVVDRLAQALDDPVALLASAGHHLDADQLPRVDLRSRALAAELRRHAFPDIGSLIARVLVNEGKIVITPSGVVLSRAIGFNEAAAGLDATQLVAEVRLARGGRAMRLVGSGREAQGRQPDIALVRLVARARQWWKELYAGRMNVSELAAREKLTPSYCTRVLRLAFLSPTIVDAVVDGKQPTSLSASKLVSASDLPPRWSEQIERFGLG